MAAFTKAGIFWHSVEHTPMLIDPASHPTRLLEVHEVAFIFRCSQENVRRLIREGQLAAIRIRARTWRVDPVDLKAFMDAQRVVSRPAPLEDPHERRAVPRPRIEVA
jgi:excisionase family DNA binding protein